MEYLSCICNVLESHNCHLTDLYIGKHWTVGSPQLNIIVYVFFAMRGMQGMQDLTVNRKIITLHRCNTGGPVPAELLLKPRVVKVYNNRFEISMSDGKVYACYIDDVGWDKKGFFVGPIVSLSR